MTLQPMGGGRFAVWAMAIALVASAGCKKGSANPDASDGPKTDGITIPDTMPGETRDVGSDIKPCVAGSKVKAAACTCDAECSSGHCADGVCCETACTEGCKTCAATGMEG